MKFAIPSYKRADSQMTFKWLKEIGAPMEDVYVFVQNEKDYEEYQKYEHSNLIFFAEKHNNAGNRNNILNYFPAGEHIVMIDDDIKEIYYKASDGEVNKIESFDVFRQLCEYGFNTAKKMKTVMFGFNQTYNRLWLQNNVSSKCMISVIFGIINTDLRFNEDLDLLVDTELCCQVMKKYQSIARINCVGYHNGREIEGGCKEFYEANRRKEAIKYLLVRYGDILKYNPQNKNSQINFKRGCKK